MSNARNYEGEGIFKQAKLCAIMMNARLSVEERLAQMRPLIAAGADLDGPCYPDEPSESSAIDVAIYTDWEFLELLLASGAKLKPGLLKKAIDIYHNEDCAIILMNHGAEPSYDLLNPAIFYGMVRASEYMIDKGVDANHVFSMNLTPLMWALSMVSSSIFDIPVETRNEMVEMLLRKGAEVDKVVYYSDGKFGNTALQKAVIDAPHFVKKLLDAGATKIINVATESGTPVFHAAKKGRQDLVRLLLVHGADPTLLPAWGTTPEALEMLRQEAIWFRRRHALALGGRTGAITRRGGRRRKSRRNKKQAH